MKNFNKTPYISSCSIFIVGLNAQQCIAGPRTSALPTTSVEIKNTSTVHPLEFLNGSPIWRVVVERQGKVRKFHSIWLRTSIVKGTTLTDEERSKAVAAQEDRLDKSKFLSSEIKHLANAIVAEAESGVVTVSKLDMVRIGAFRKAKAITKTGANSMESIDLFDGVKEGHFQLLKERKDDGNAPKIKHIWAGSVSLDKKSAMDRTANFGLDILLMQANLIETFNPAESSWIVDKDAFVLTTKNKEGLDLRLTLSKTTGCPLSVERLQLVTHKVLYKHQVTKTQVVDGVEMPSEIVSYLASGDPVKDYQFKYTLQSCELNDKVDVNLELLPPGTQVSDFRLGLDNPVTYSIADGKLPTDITVKKLAAGKTPREMESGKEDNPSKRVQSSIFTAPLLGLLLVGFGGICWIKGNRD